MSETNSAPERTQVGFRMLNEHVTELDKLCQVNKRSRREIIEILISEAHGFLATNPDDRINPT